MTKIIDLIRKVIQEYSDEVWRKRQSPLLSAIFGSNCFCCESLKVTQRIR